MRRQRERPRSPVVLVPGDGGNQLEAKLDKPSVVHYLCEKKSKDYFTLWMNLEIVLPIVIDCWIDNMRLVYNETTHTTMNSPGVSIRIPGWGDTATVEWIDPSRISLGNYFVSLVETLVSLGYERNVSVRGAPYDFRKAPNDNQQYFEDLTKLIEDTYYLNNESKVVTIGHSMGNAYMLYFFSRKSQEWKDKFIRAHVSIAGPYGGSIKIVKAFASGYNLEQWRIILPPLKVRKEQRTMTSSSFLLPTREVWNDDVLVVTANRNYTSHDYEQFFKDIGFPTGWQMYQDTRNLISDLPAPGVE
ncbi:unnamed protein product, partial [Soboliphyme baturini]|uniref:Phospholipase A2, group XV n=1 Tax=Soboliphyme baturini TaxID=241478 RepID=A0A183J2I2_9BILA